MKCFSLGLLALTVFQLSAPIFAESAPDLLDQWPMPTAGSIEGVAVDSSGNVYVTDRQLFRVYKFDHTGALLRDWHAVCPKGIGVDSQGFTYVGDQCANTVHKFDSEGAEVLTWSSPTPWPIFVDHNDYVYAGSYHQGTVSKYDTNGTLLLTIGGLGNGQGQICNTHGMAVDQFDNVYVTDSCNRVQKFDPLGVYVNQWYGGGAGAFATPLGVVVDGAGNVYVSEYWANRIQKFANDGTFIVAWGGFNHPVGLALDADEKLYVADAQNDAVKIFASPAAHVACVGFETPMAVYPVTVKKSRALPLKARIFDADGFAVTGGELAAPPVLQVLYDSGLGGGAVDVTDDSLSAGMGTEGNQFEFTDDGYWQFNLKTNNYTAPGTYIVTMEPGGASEYVFDAACLTEFVIQ